MIVIVSTLTNKFDAIVSRLENIDMEEEELSQPNSPPHEAHSARKLPTTTTTSTTQRDHVKLRGNFVSSTMELRVTSRNACGIRDVARLAALRGYVYQHNPTSCHIHSGSLCWSSTW